MPQNSAGDSNTRAAVGRARVAALLAVLLCTAGLAATQAFAHSARPAAGKKVVISTRNVRGLGQVLVNDRGLTLYMFVPDKRRSVTCHSTCAIVWPPVFLPTGGKAISARLAKQSLLSSDKDSSGGRVVTYHGWPLYTYVADTKPGMATGQAINLNGGLWYVLSPSGKVIKHKPTST